MKFSSSPVEKGKGDKRAKDLNSLFTTLKKKNCQWIFEKKLSLISPLLFNHSVMSNSLWSQRLQHTRLPCPSPSPRACSNSFPLSRRCHPTILFSIVPFSSCLQSFPASSCFPMSQLFAWGNQSNGTSASALVLLMNIQDWLVWSPCYPRHSQESSPTPQFERMFPYAANYARAYLIKLPRVSKVNVE